MQEGIYDEFITKFIAAAKARKLGDPMDPSTAQGPQISEIHFNVRVAHIRFRVMLIGSSRGL